MSSRSRVASNYRDPYSLPLLNARIIARVPGITGINNPRKGRPGSASLINSTGSQRATSGVLLGQCRRAVSSLRDADSPASTIVNSDNRICNTMY